MTTVINIKDAPEGWMYNADYVYIGREGAGFNGYFGNPFAMSREEYRSSVVQDYIRFALRRYTHDYAFQRQVDGLYGKILVCFCAPKLCHGDILALIADLNAEKATPSLY